MTYDYEKSIWGKGDASLKFSNPTCTRLREALSAITAVQSGSKVLEVGCGAGQFIRAVKTLRPDLQCYGTDISRRALEIARNDGGEVTYDLQTGGQLPYDDGTFSAVLIFDVLEHVNEPAEFLREINRVLIPGGIVYAFVPCEGDILSVWNWLGRMGVLSGLTKKHAGHIVKFSRRDLKKLFEEVGFKVRYLRHAEHLFGQFLGVMAFIAMDRASKRQGEQLNNEAYFEKQRSNPALNILKNAVNTVVSAESWLFSRVPSPNVHIIVNKL